MCLLFVCAHAFNFNLLLTELPKSFLGIPKYSLFHDKIYCIVNSYLFLLPRWEMPHLCYLQYIYCQIVKDHKGKKKVVFQNDTSTGILETWSSKLFYGKVSPIVTTTKKRPCHFATYGSGKAREPDYFRTNVSPERTMLLYTCLLETTFSPLAGNGRPLRKIV